MKLYVASSWRNPYQPNVVGILRTVGHDVYDFRHPPGGDHLGLSWSDAGVLVLPCGRSAHLEAGWFVGAGKPLYIVLDEAEFGHDAGHHVTELMYRMATKVCRDLDELLAELYESPLLEVPVPTDLPNHTAEMVVAVWDERKRVAGQLGPLPVQVLGGES